MKRLHKLLVFWNNKEFAQERKESINFPVYKKGDKMNCKIYRKISLYSIIKYSFQQEYLHMRIKMYILL
jgi:hypothetical protein